MNVVDAQKVVDEGITSFSKGMEALGKGPVDSLAGVRGCSRRCLVANSVIRSSYNGHSLWVRSRKQAKILAETWGTTWGPVEQKRKDRMRGYVDYDAIVETPRSLQKLAEDFDEGELYEIETTVGRTEYDGDRVPILKVTRSKPVKGKWMTVDEAVQLTKALIQ